MGLAEFEWLNLSDWAEKVAKNFPPRRKSLTTLAENSSEGLSAPTVDVPSRIKFKRLDKTARHIMQLCVCIYIFSEEHKSFILHLDMLKL